MTPATWVALAERFALGPPRGTPAYVTRGAMGEIWRLDTAHGRWAVKWQFPWAPTDPRPPDLAVQAAAASAGVPLPLPVTTPQGHALARVGRRHARVYHWVDTGPPLTAPVDPGPAAEAGRLLGVLHGMALPAEGPIDPWYTTPPAVGSWDSLADRAAAAGEPWAAGLAAARPLIAELTALAVPPPARPAIVCHRDFTPANVLTRPHGGLIVLDWENAGPQHPERELGHLLVDWAGGRRFSAAAATALADGYAAAAGDLPRLEAGCFASAAATPLNMLHVMAAQALDDPAPVHRRYARQRVTGLLDGGLQTVRRNIELASRTLSR